MWLPREMRRLLRPRHRGILSPHAPGRKPIRALWRRVVRFPAANLYARQRKAVAGLAALSGKHSPPLAVHCGTRLPDFFSRCLLCFLPRAFGVYAMPGDLDPNIGISRLIW
jgi:hypothetical protein